jgi:hypothetical protein
VTFAPTALDQVDGARTVTCVPASGSVFPIGTSTATCSATDTRGNTTSGELRVTVLDSHPIVTVPGNLSAAATSADGATVTFAASASDTIDGALTPTCMPASGSTFAPGTTVVTCTAADAQGNTGSASFTVTVSMAWSGILQPINADGSSVFKQGNTIPVKFRLTGASAGIPNLTAQLTVQKISNTVLGSVIEATASGQGDTGNTFRYDPTDDVYIYNWSTKSPITHGTYQLTIDMAGSPPRTVRLSLKP